MRVVIRFKTAHLLAYFNVRSVSSYDRGEGESAATIAVFEFPPKLSRSNHVSTESR
jgi:hypothetical protein